MVATPLDFAAAFVPAAPTTQLAITLPYHRPGLHIPRRDLVVSSGDSLAMTVSIVATDDPGAAAIQLTGGEGGPTLSLQILSDSCTGWPWDYGHACNTRGAVLFAVAGTISTTLAGTFDLFVPVGTLTDFPPRCTWLIQLGFDGALQAQLLASGSLHVMPGFTGPASTAAAITTDALAPITTD